MEWHSHIKISTSEWFITRKKAAIWQWVEIPELADTQKNAGSLARTFAASLNKNDMTIETAVHEWMAWTKENFPKSTAESSLVHLQREIKEVLEELNADEPSPRQHEAVMSLMEYADCILCLLTSAGMAGLTIDQLFRAIINKMQINYKRKWVDNGDGTYSHVKE